MHDPINIIFNSSFTESRCRDSDIRTSCVYVAGPGFETEVWRMSILPDFFQAFQENAGLVSLICPTLSSCTYTRIFKDIDFCYCFERIKDSSEVTYVSEITQDLSHKWCQWRKITLFNKCFGNDVLYKAFLSWTKNTVAIEYSAENSYWVFLHQRCLLHTTRSKTEME